MDCAAFYPWNTVSVTSQSVMLQKGKGWAKLQDPICFILCPGKKDIRPFCTARDISSKVQQGGSAVAGPTNSFFCSQVGVAASLEEDDEGEWTCLNLARKSIGPFSVAKLCRLLLE